ncbi:hypothetical protein CEXT_571661 [Caerostris extrusa]|uniref:Uncharacterized protein n=1 Tax=Caerostris extrusa TaxID=172846 RepID=A0AAV4PID7_CAEEX|nr:hypothetical protein CEXT_571661 [Caerostris extrusa]
MSQTFTEDFTQTFTEKGVGTTDVYQETNERNVIGLGRNLFIFDKELRCKKKEKKEICAKGLEKTSRLTLALKLR